MVDQTKVANGNGRPAGDDASPVGAARLARDVLELGELQARLLLLDAQASSAHARAAIACVVTGAIFVLCTVAVALVWIAAALVEWAGWPWVAGLAVSAGVGALLAGVLLLVAWSHWRRGWSVWRRSRHELGSNVDWLKATLDGRKDSSGRSPQPAQPPN